ncbi:MAG: superoxide dismutase family protein [Clostridia bacterium]|nr:superoxide dismutase family protein [Clostridia bacterium]
MYRYSSRPDAVAYVHGGADAPNIHGQVRFYQEPGSVLVVADVAGLPQDSESGFFGFHIHEGNSCVGAGFPQTGSHYNPGGAAHPRHAGDLPPLMMQQDRAHMAVRTDRFRVQDILGRTVVIHSHPDDFRTQPAGNAGTKIACGVIGTGCRQ